MLSDRTRRIVVNAMVVLGAVVFSLILVLVVFGDEERTPEKRNRDDAAIYEYGGRTVLEEDSRKKYDGGVVGETSVDDDVRRKTEEIAVEFVKTFHNYDGDKPLQHIEASRKWMSDELYKAITSTYPQEAEETTVNRRWKQVKASLPSGQPDGFIVWDVEVLGEVTDSQGKKKESVDTYLVKLEKIDGEYRVTDFLVNHPVERNGNGEIIL